MHGYYKQPTSQTGIAISPDGQTARPGYEPFESAQ